MHSFSSPSHVRYERSASGVATLVLDDEASHNALSVTMLHALAHALERAAQDDEARVLILTGCGKTFSVGADTTELAALESQDASEFAALGRATFARLRTLAIPTIATINGLALGGGLELALCCDLRWSSSRATFGFPEITHKLCPAWGGSELLSQHVSPAWRSDLLLSARLLSAERAQEIGLVTRIFKTASFRDDVAAAVNELTRHSDEALRGVTALLRGTDSESRCFEKLVAGRSRSSSCAEELSL